jgi:hypothetical protein
MRTPRRKYTTRSSKGLTSPCKFCRRRIRPELLDETFLCKECKNASLDLRVYGAESLRESAHPAGSFCSGREVAPQIRLAGGRDRLAPLGGVPGGGLTQLTCRGVVVANRTTRDRSRHLGPALDEPATNGGDHSVAGRGCHVVKVAVGKVAGERGDLDRTTGGLGGCCWATQEKCGANQGKRGCSRDEPAASRCCHGWSLRFGTVRNLFGAASNIAVRYGAKPVWGSLEHCSPRSACQESGPPHQGPSWQPRRLRAATNRDSAPPRVPPRRSPRLRRTRPQPHCAMPVGTRTFAPALRSQATQERQRSLGVSPVAGPPVSWASDPHL